MDLVFKTNTYNSSQSLQIKNKSLDEQDPPKNNNKEQKSIKKNILKEQYLKDQKRQLNKKINKDKPEGKQKKETSLKSNSQQNSLQKTNEVSQHSTMEQRSKLKIRTAGLCLLAMFIGILFSYGFSSKLNSGFFTDLQNHSLVGITFIGAAIFVVIGFGLLFSYYIQTIFTGIFTALYIVSSTLILSPLLQKFWMNIFIGNFDTSTTHPNLHAQVIIQSNNITKASVNYVNLKLALCCAISQLIIHISLIGKMQIYKTILTSIIFVAVWNLNYYLCLHLLNISPDSRFFDDYSISMVYIFGTVASLVMTFDVPSNLHKLKSSKKHINFPKILSFIGVFFLWLSFSMTFSIVGVRKQQLSPGDQFGLRAVFYPEASIGIFFALSSSVVSTMAFSIIFNQKCKFQALLGGSLSGAIMYGSIATFSTNIAIPITLGIVSAFFSVWYNSKLMPFINKKQLNDSLGLFGGYSITAVFGVIMVAPIVIYCYINYGLLPQYMIAAVANDQRIGWVLIYVGISSLGGLLCGMINSTIMRCLKGQQQYFGDHLNFLQVLKVQQRQLQQGLNSALQLSQLQEQQVKSQ